MTGVRFLTRASIALAVSLTLAGCGADTQVGGAAGEGNTTVSPSNGDDSQDSSSATATPSESPGGTAGSEQMTPDQLAEVATQDLADRIGVPADQITVSRNDAVTWPDGSLGCPESDMGYISVLSPGQLIVLAAGGGTYEYHSGRQVAPFLCENPQPPLPAN